MTKHDMIAEVEKILGGTEDSHGGELTRRVLDTSTIEEMWEGREVKKQVTTRFDDISRLIYLVAELRVPISRSIFRYLPNSEQFRWDLLSKGIGMVEGIETMMDYYIAGREGGHGSIEEVKTILVRIALATGALDRAAPAEQISFFSAVSSLLDLGMVGTDFVEVDLLDPNLQDIDKFDTGFAPFDAPLGGFYQGLVGVMGEPGTGKTSLTIALAESCIRNGLEVWYFENEIPAGVMGGRFNPVVKRNDDEVVQRLRLFCGPYNADKIVEMVRKEPNPNRVIIFDSPDVVFSSSGDSRRFDLEAAYQTLISIKPLCKFVVVTTQMQRKTGGAMTIKSVAESWAKSWYVDILLGLEIKSQQTVSVKVLKNRFGPRDVVAYFAFNYSNLTWNFDADTLGQDIWDASGAGEW